jgi:hypothetical protein
MNTIEVTDFRRRSYARAMQRVLVECDRFGISNLWDTDLRSHQPARAAAIVGSTASLTCWLDQAIHHAMKAGSDFADAAAILSDRRSELRSLELDVKIAARPHEELVDVVVLDDDWGKKGRAAKIRTWINEHSATWQQVAQRFQLAESTAKRYIREAKKGRTA